MLPQPRRWAGSRLSCGSDATGPWALSSASARSTSASPRRVQQAYSSARNARSRATAGSGWAGSPDGCTLPAAATVVSFVTYISSVRRITRWPPAVTSQPTTNPATSHRVKTQAKPLTSSSRSASGPLGALRLAPDATKRVDLGGGAGAGLGPPFQGGDDAGFHQLETVEEASDPLGAAEVVGRLGGLVPDACGLHHLRAGVG